MENLSLGGLVGHKQMFAFLVKIGCRLLTSVRMGVGFLNDVKHGFI